MFPYLKSIYRLSSTKLQWIRISLRFFIIQIRKQIRKLNSALYDPNMGYLVKPGMTTTPEKTRYPNFNS